MAGFDSGIKVFFGGDTSGLRASLNEANGLVDGFTKSVKKAGIDLGRGFGFGLLIFQAKQFFTAVINDAQDTRDAFEEMGKPVPSSVASVARLADEVDRLKKTSIEWGTTLLSWITKAGEGWGMLINRIRGVSREQEKLYEQIERDREKQEKNRDEAFKNAAEKRKAREEKDRREAEQAAERSDREREKRLEDEYNDLVKVGKAQSDLDDAKKKALYDQMSLSAKITADEKEKVSLSKQIADYKKNGVLSSNDQLKVIELENKLLEVNTRLTEAKLKTEKGITAERRAQLEAMQAADEAQGKMNLLLKDTIILMGKAYGTSRDPGDFEGASDEELRSLVAKNLEEIALIEGNKGRGLTAGADAATGFLPQGIVQDRLKTDIQRALYQLDLRSGLQNDAAMGGQDYARRNFQGDPLQFDELFAQFVKGQTVQEKSAQTLQDIKDALTRRGIVTIPLGGTTK